MTRKLIVLLVVVLSICFKVAAQEVKNQPPILAQRSNKWYAVSPIDGSATVLVEPAEGEKLLPLQENNLSSDGQLLAYGTFKYDKVLKASRYSLYLMNLSTRIVESINPSGGIFDRPVPATHTFQIFDLTWSYDGTRLYYVRMENENGERTVAVAGQLAYYDMGKRNHHLVARLDPALVVDEVTPLPNGVVLRSVKGGSDTAVMSLYAANNAVVNVSKLANVYSRPLRLADQFYFFEISDDKSTTLFDVETGESQTFEEEYHPAFRSQVTGDQSLRLFRIFDNGGKWLVYTRDGKTLIQTLPDKIGARIAVSPDGQSIAYVAYAKPGVGKIQVMDSDRTMRELPFDAELIVWGALEGELFAVSR